MERPIREKFASQALYEEARAKYVEHMLGAGSRLAQRLAAVEAQLALLSAKPEPLTETIEDQIRQHAHGLITMRYTGTDQLNILRKGTRVGASREEMLAVEIMDEWIDAVRDACASHIAELKAMPDDARNGYDWLQGWPKEA